MEDALNLPIPMNAQYIRNLILIAHALHDHIVHFYHLSALDWVDVTQEASLLGNPIADAAHPLEVLRTVHSFDPCMACAVHMFDPEGNNVAKVNVL